jgi:protein-arginine kinase activator protein McsA
MKCQSCDLRDFTIVLVIPEYKNGKLSRKKIFVCDECAVEFAEEIEPILNKMF